MENLSSRLAKIRHELGGAACGVFAALEIAKSAEVKNGGLIEVLEATQVKLDKAVTNLDPLINSNLEPSKAFTAYH